MDFEAKFFFFFCALSLYMAIYLLRIMPTLQEHGRFDPKRFLFHPLYIFQSASHYYDICKTTRQSLAWFHFYQLNFILWCLLILL